MNYFVPQLQQTGIYVYTYWVNTDVIKLGIINCQKLYVKELEELVQSYRKTFKSNILRRALCNTQKYLQDLLSQSLCEITKAW